MGSDVSLSKAVRANLLSLQNTAQMMDKTQSRLATGNKVNSALDNPSNFFTASALNSRAADMSNLLDSMASGIKVIEAANNGITALTKNLESMQSTLRQARQDKSFQTKSFDVSDSTKISIGGGQFGDLATEISLADATQAGKKALVETTGTADYLGPQSSDEGKTGAGARSVISGLGGIGAGDTFTVAGRTVNVSTPGGGAPVTAETIVADIKTALNQTGSTVAGKYTVDVGTGDNAGQIIIESVDTSAPAATVTFGAGTVPATKGTTSFNYSAITSSVTAGGLPVQTGATFEDFVKNLEDGAAEGKYTVTKDATTKQITLTSTEWGGAAPSVTGIPDASVAHTGSAAETSFALASTSNGATPPVYSLNHTQDLTIGSFGTVSLTSGMDKEAVEDAFALNTSLTALFDVTVNDDLSIELKEKVNGGATAPAVSSSQTATPANRSFSTVTAGGVDYTNAAAGDAALAAMTGGSIKLTSGSDTETFALGAGATVANLISTLNDSGFTVEARNGGFAFSRADGASFDIEVNGGSNAALGLGAATTTVTNGAAATTNGIVGGSASTLATTTTVDYTDNAVLQDPALAGIEINLDAGGGKTATYTFSATSTKNDLETTLTQNGFKVAASATGLSITRPDGSAFTMEIVGGTAADLGFASSTVSSTGGATGTVTSADGDADVAAIDGKTSVVPTQGASVAKVDAQQHTFTVSYDGKTANISIGGVKGGVDSPVNALDTKNWQDATITAVNASLKTQGIEGIEVKFDDEGKMQFVAKSAEEKTLAISGKDAVALFGTEGVNTGVAEKSELNAKKTVDKFVELINRDLSGKVRASNDNGKLRIENLSTQELDINIDTDGALSGIKVDGNSNRSNFAQQFNAARDQLDKFADDASFNGINLLRGDKLKITFNESGTSSIDIQAKDKNGNVRGINASNLSIDSLVAEDLDTDEKIDAFLATLSTALTELRSQASAFGSNLSSVENRQSFTKNMINTLETGASNLTLADTNEEAANLLALQTRQQLSSSALSMASQQDQAVLQLLR